MKSPIFQSLKPVSIHQEKIRKLIVYILYFLSALGIGISFFFIQQIKVFIFSKYFLFLLITACLLFIYAHIEPFFPQFTYQTLQFENIRRPYILVQLSDIHLQYPYFAITEEKLKKIFTKVNSLNPDFILLTGDYISRFRSTSITKRNTQSLSRALSILKAQQGIFAILGNNDFCGLEFVLEALAQAHICVLRNQSVLFDEISITGLDSCKNLEIAKSRLRSIPPPKAQLRILLSHEPDVALLSKSSYDLQLSGHSHGGQFILPFLGPIVYATMAYHFPVGLFQIEKMLVCFTRHWSFSSPETFNSIQLLSRNFCF